VGSDGWAQVPAKGLAFHRETGGRGFQPEPAARAGRHGSRVRRTAERQNGRRVAHVSESEARFIRSFRTVFGETPHRYLQRRRVERSMFLLRETERSVTDICLDVGFSSLGTFSRTFREIVGETPSGYRTGHGPIVAHHCVQLAAMRPLVSARVAAQSSNFGEAAGCGSALGSGPTAMNSHT
jgi:AraC-like DNA-binding protein